ncbi:MAG: serine/threonine protein kinase [Phycisphaerales bacterium]|nr:MAG: serine/threonine protein kinase [Phycisphaerales bacterium]
MNGVDRFRRVDEIFRAAVRLKSDERESFLRERCADDPTLVEDVRALLDEDEASSPEGGPLDRPALGASVDLNRIAEANRQRETVPESIGTFRVIRVLGSGGMGTVYEAEQDEPRRRVALKMIRGQGVSESTRRRFRRETEVLGRLTHPGIAQIYEAGTAAASFAHEQTDPMPYFAMELVVGRPIDVYAKAHELDTLARLELIALIADALDYAHGRGVIHRDLKPANLLVAASGKPKILDFGIARATHTDTRAATVQTEVGQLIGTIAYMSPEQAAGDANRHPLDHRSDVYSLGVVAYELLTGRMPYELCDVMAIEAVRIIREVEPTSASTISRDLRGDVETIIGKSLEKDPARRYQSAGAFAADIRRVLADQPIEARRPSALYQLRKFSKRNKPLVASIAAAFVILVAGLIGVSLSLARAIHAERDALAQRDEAHRQQAIALAVSDFLTDDLIGAVDPDLGLGSDVTVSAALDRAASMVEERFEHQPEIEAEIRTAIGRSYSKLGAFHVAEPHLVRAYELRRDIYGPRHHRTSNAAARLGKLYTAQSKYADAEEILTELLHIVRTLEPHDVGDQFVTMSNLADVYRRQGRHNEALPLLEEAIELARGTVDPDDPGFLSTLLSLAGAYRGLDRLEDAEAIYQEALEILPGLYGDEHPRTLRARNGLALVYGRMDRPDLAIPILEGIRQVALRRQGESHVNTIAMTTNLAAMYRRDGMPDEARAMFERNLEITHEVLGKHHRIAIITASLLARLYISQEEFDLARALLLETIDASVDTLGEEHDETRLIMRMLDDLARRTASRDEG